MELSINIMFTEGSLEVKLPTIWTDGKAEVGRVSEQKESVERRSEKRNSPKKEDAGARKGSTPLRRECTKHLSFGAFLEVEPFKKCTWLRREAHVEVKMHKTPQLRSAFGS